MVSYIRLGTFGAMIEYGIERRITPNSNLGATMIIGVPFGVTLRVKFTRATQTYTFPIHLADEVSLVLLFNNISFIKFFDHREVRGMMLTQFQILMQPIFYGTVTPLLAWFTVQKLIIDPYATRKKQAEKQRMKESNLQR